jgi:hypothetical protein
VATANAVRDALDMLIGVEIIVPVWDAVEDNGGNTLYRVVTYARVEIMSYQLPGQNQISAQFLGFGLCSNLWEAELDSLPVDSLRAQAIRKED